MCYDVFRSINFQGVSDCFRWTLHWTLLSWFATLNPIWSHHTPVCPKLSIYVWKNLKKHPVNIFHVNFQTFQFFGDGGAPPIFVRNPNHPRPKMPQIQTLKDLIAFTQKRFDAMLDQEGMEQALEISEIKKKNQEELRRQRCEVKRKTRVCIICCLVEVSPCLSLYVYIYIYTYYTHNNYV